MDLVKCAGCGEEVSKDSVTCPKCGRPIKSAEEKKPSEEVSEPTPTPQDIHSTRSKLYVYILLALVIIILILIIIF